MKHWMWSFIWLITLVAMSAVPAWAEKWDVIKSVDHLRYAAYLSMRRRSNKQVVIDRRDRMSMLMKGLKVVGLGVAIWRLGLLWPEVNLVLTLLVMIGVVLGLGVAAVLAYVLGQRLDQRQDHDKAGQDHPSPDTSVSADSIAVLNTA